VFETAVIEDAMSGDLRLNFSRSSYSISPATHQTFLTYKKYLFFLSDPDFVSSLEDEDHVYFFFRESAVEYINCGKVSSSIDIMVDVISYLL